MQAVTVHQLLNTPVAMDLVALVGQLRTIHTPTSEYWEAYFSDNTGLITVKTLRLHTTADVSERIHRESAEVLEDAHPLAAYDDRYVSIILRDTIIQNIRLVTDFNEITAHNLQCIYEHCVREHGNK